MTQVRRSLAALALASFAVLAVLAGACSDDGDGDGRGTATVTRRTCTPVAASPAARETASGTEPVGGAEATVRTADSSLGTILVDAEGMTLYTFDHDSPCSETTACVGSCPANWPPLTAADDPVAAPGVTGQLDTIERDDGTRHVTYKGNRLYRSSLDTAPGDTNGDGVAGVWHVARP